MKMTKQKQLIVGVNLKKIKSIPHTERGKRYSFPSLFLKNILRRLKGYAK